MLCVSFVSDAERRVSYRRIQLGKKINLVLVNIEGNDIMTGNRTLTLGLGKTMGKASFRYPKENAINLSWS